MFRNASQPKSTVQLLANAVWGTSLGGLVLFAEERRRQVAFAQKIIENGKRLQAYKAYSTAAALAEFDLNEPLDAGPQRQSAPIHDYSREPPGDAITKPEWRTRGRKRKLFPLATSSSSADLGSHRHPRSSQHSAFDAQLHLRADDSSLAIPSDHRYAQHLQNVVAERVRSCLSSQCQSTRDKGFQELAAFFGQVRQDLGAFVHKFVPTSRISMAPSGQSADPQDLHELISSIAIDATPHDDDSTRFNYSWLLRRSSRFTNSECVGQLPAFRIDQYSFAARIIDCVRSNQLSSAFYEFLAFCDHMREPIAGCVRAALRELITAYRSVGLYSVVLELEWKTLLILKEWRLFYEDLKWLIHAETPDQLLGFLVRAITSLVDVQQFEKAFEAYSICAQSCTAGTISESQLCEVLGRTLDSLASAKRQQDIQKHIVALHRECLEKKLFNAANAVLHNGNIAIVATKFSSRYFSRACNLLIAGDCLEQALELYTGILKYHAEPAKLYDVYRHARFFKLALLNGHYERSGELVRMIRERQLQLPAKFRTDYVEVFKKIIAPLVSNQHDKQAQQSLSVLRPVVNELFTLAKDRGELTLGESLHGLLAENLTLDARGMEELLAVYHEQCNFEKIVALASEYKTKASLSPLAADMIVQACCKVSDSTKVDNILKSLFSVQDLSDKTLEALAYSGNKSFIRAARSELIGRHYENGQFDQVLTIFRNTGRYENLNNAAAKIVYDIHIKRGSLTNIEEHLDELLSQASSAYAWQSLHSSLVVQCWNRSKDFGLVKRLFEKIQSKAPARPHSSRLHDAVIRLSVETRKLDEVQRVFARMTEDASVQGRISTLSPIMFARALDRDWKGVDEVLHIAKEAGFLEMDFQEERTFFDSTFSEFCNQNTAKTSVEFAIRLATEFGITISPKISECTLKKVVQEEDFELLSRWLEFVKIKGLSQTIPKASLGLLTHRISQDRGLKFIAAHSPSATLHSLRISADYGQLYGQWRRIASKPGALNRRLEPRGSSQPVGRQMLMALVENRPAEAVSAYETSLARGLLARSVDVALAVYASMSLSPGSADNAAALLERARAAGLSADRAEAACAILTIRRSSLTMEQARSVVFRFYRTVDRRGFGLHHHVTIAAAQKLHEQGQGKAGLQLLDEAQSSAWGARKPFDLASLTLCLRIFSELGSAEGVLWVVNAVLERNLRIDQKFLRTLRVSRSRCLRAKRRTGDASAAVALLAQGLEQGLSKCKNRRREQCLRSLQFAMQTAQVLDVQRETSK